jgi:ABC-type branched-subunit amino acid transport system substrate-binding protein
MKAQDKAIIKVISLGNLEVEGEISQTATIYRNDTWGKGLSDEINDFIGTSAGWFMPNEPIIGYDPTSYNVASIVKNVNDEMIAVRDGDGKTASAFGIMLISFAEGTEFLAAASKYDWLTQLMWYGASAYAQDPSLLERNSAAEFAYKTRFSCPIFALNVEDENKWGEVKEGIENATGKQANSYAILGYDAAMLACLCESSIFTNDTLANDVDALIRTTLSEYDCKTGTFVFDENGDRPEGNYDFWSIRKDAKTGEYKWIVTGTYYPETDQFSVTKEYFD